MNYIQKAILIAGAAFCFNLTMSAQDITLKNKNITVKEAMEELKKTSGYSEGTEKVITIQSSLRII